ncbi:ESPR domain-containing protein, partial [Escherichia coli]|uniref:ESPR domain-containing protein n=1 Tax=Escherichia coli TaxID=562 RepID=UPI002157DBC0
MNKIYSLKYCPVTQGLIAVSELACRVVKRTGRKLKTLTLITVSATSLAYPAISQAGIVRADIAYQIYRDFAENKGLFVPGATNIPVYDKDGKLVGRLDKAPMVDFSNVNTNGVATLVSPQYVVSVKHNGGYQSVGFGNGKNSYSIVDCVFRSIRSRIGIEVRSAIRIHSINRELNFFYRFLTRFFAAF